MNAHMKNFILEIRFLNNIFKSDTALRKICFDENISYLTFLHFDICSQIKILLKYFHKSHIISYTANDYNEIGIELAKRIFRYKFPKDVFAMSLDLNNSQLVQQLWLLSNLFTANAPKIQIIIKKIEDQADIIDLVSVIDNILGNKKASLIITNFLFGLSFEDCYPDYEKDLFS